MSFLPPPPPPPGIGSGAAPALPPPPPPPLAPPPAPAPAPALAPAAAESVALEFADEAALAAIPIGAAVAPGASDSATGNGGRRGLLAVGIGGAAIGVLAVGAVFALRDESNVQSLGSAGSGVPTSVLEADDVVARVTTTLVTDVAPATVPETAVATTVPATTVPATTAPVTTVPATTVPATTVSVTTVPDAAAEVAESTAVVRNGQIFLEGAVPTVEDGQAIVALAAEILGPDNVFNNYTVDPRAGDPNLGNITVEDTINFGPGSTVILPEAEGLLNQGLALFTIRPSMTLLVVGHTDDIGTAEYNEQLSLERAEAVRAWFVDHGVDSSRITTRGAGESEPIDSNATDTGRSRNRRIQFFLENILG